MFDKARRDFMTYLSILGVVGVTGITLEAKESEFEGIGDTNMDPFFDPDGWL